VEASSLRLEEDTARDCLPAIAKAIAFAGGSEGGHLIYSLLL